MKGNSDGNDVARDLRAKYRLDRPAARADILRAFEACHGDATRAAQLLGVARRTVNRYLKDDEVIANAVAEIRAAKRAREAAAQ